MDKHVPTLAAHHPWEVTKILWFVNNQREAQTDMLVYWNSAQRDWYRGWCQRPFGKLPGCVDYGTMLKPLLFLIIKTSKREDENKCYNNSSCYMIRKPIVRDTHITLYWGLHWQDSVLPLTPTFPWWLNSLYIFLKYIQAGKRDYIRRGIPPITTPLPWRSTQINSENMHTNKKAAIHPGAEGAVFDCWVDF